MIKNKYQEITIEQGDQLGLIGMQIVMEREHCKVIISQPKQIAQIIESFKVTKGASSPALVKLMTDEDNSPLLTDQSDYMLKCAMLMFLLQ